MRIIAAIQARMSSQRLPGKVMLNILGKPMIWHIYSRLKNCKQIDDVVISTGDVFANAPIWEYARGNKIPLFVGSEVDLIDRLYQTAVKFEASALVRITADCPLVDPSTVDHLVKEFVANIDKIDIVTNSKIRTFPHGLDAEVYSLEILKKLHHDISEPELREWFPLYIEKNSVKFRILNIKNSDDLSKLRWTVDYYEDFKFIERIYEELYNINPIFGMSDVLKLLEKKPEIMQINSKYIDHHNVGAPKI